MKLAEFTLGRVWLDTADVAGNRLLIGVVGGQSALACDDRYAAFLRQRSSDSRRWLHHDHLDVPIDGMPKSVAPGAVYREPDSFFCSSPRSPGIGTGPSAQRTGGWTAGALVNAHWKRTSWIAPVSQRGRPSNQDLYCSFAPGSRFTDQGARSAADRDEQGSTGCKPVATTCRAVIARWAPCS